MTQNPRAQKVTAGAPSSRSSAAPRAMGTGDGASPARDTPSPGAGGTGGTASPGGQRRPLCGRGGRLKRKKEDVGYEGGTRTSVKGRQTSYICYILKTGKPQKKTFPHIFGYFLLHLLFEFPKDFDKVPPPDPFKKCSCARYTGWLSCWRLEEAFGGDIGIFRGARPLAESQRDPLEHWAVQNFPP